MSQYKYSNHTMLQIPLHLYPTGFELELKTDESESSVVNTTHPGGSK